MQDSVARLKRYASRRLADPEEEALTDYVSAILDRQGDRVFSDFLVPETCALGFATSCYRELDEPQKLALNHWAYRMQYRKISDGERFLLVVNGLIADLIEPGAPEIAALLRRESDEERDHIAAFTLLGESMERYYGYQEATFPRKPLRGVFVSRPFCQWLTAYFGSDFMVTYFLGRGIANHLGKGFELAVASTGTTANRSLHYLSHLHSLHEHHHTGVSHMLSSCAHEVLGQEEKRGALYDILVKLMHRASVWSTFAATPTRAVAARMSYKALRAMPIFAARSDEFLRELVKGHFARESGIEAAQTAHMPRFNARLVRNAALRPEQKTRWVAHVEADPGHQTWFPPAFEIG